MCFRRYCMKILFLEPFYLLNFFVIETIKKKIYIINYTVSTFHGLTNKELQTIEVAIKNNDEHKILSIVNN